MFTLALLGYAGAFLLVLVFVWASYQAHQLCMLGRLGAALVMVGALAGSTKLLLQIEAPTWHLVAVLYGGCALLGGSLLRNGALREHLTKLKTRRAWFVASERSVLAE